MREDVDRLPYRRLCYAEFGSPCSFGYLLAGGQRSANDLGQQLFRYFVLAEVSAGFVVFFSVSAHFSQSGS